MRVERRFSKGAEVRADDEATATASGKKISGYAAVFNEFYTLYEDPGFLVRETIKPGAFAPVMSDDVRCLFNHDADNVLGRSTNGTLSMDQDTKGLAYSNAMDETRIGRDVYAFVKRGDVTGCSFAFIVAKAEWLEEELENGQTRWTRTITEMQQLFDVGPVTYPAYEQTNVDARKLVAELRGASATSDIPEEVLKRIEAGKPKGMSEEQKAAYLKQSEIRSQV